MRQYRRDPSRTGGNFRALGKPLPVAVLRCSHRGEAGAEAAADERDERAPARHHPRHRAPRPRRPGTARGPRSLHPTRNPGLLRRRGSLIPPRWDSGMKWLADSEIDLFAFTLDKSSGDFSPTTRYRDYAINRDLIHWESQSATSPSPGDWSTACPLISSRSSQRQRSRSWRDLATPSTRDSFLSVTHRQGPNVETAVPQVPRGPCRSRTIRSWRR